VAAYTGAQREAKKLHQVSNRRTTIGLKECEKTNIMLPSLLCMVLLISAGRSSNEGRHTKASEPEFQDKDYDDQVGDYEDEIYSYEEQKTTSQHPKNLQAIAEADFYSRDPEYHDADYDDKFVVITDRLLVNVGKRQDYALTIATGTLAFLAVIVIGLMAFRYSECNKNTKFHQPTPTLLPTKLVSKDAKELKPIISGLKATRAYNKLKQEESSAVGSEEDLMLKISV